MNIKILRYLDKLYPNLYKMYAKEHRTNINETDKFRLIEEYLNRLQQAHTSAKKSEQTKKLLLDMYYKKYVIKRENINASVKEKDRIIKAQEDSLKTWLTYLNDDNAKYPIWAKFLAFQGMLRIGTYNEANDVYMRRNKSTTAPFVEANPEAIAKCIGLIRDYVEEENEIDSEFASLIKNGNFNKLYTLILNKVKKNAHEHSGFEGIWVEYKEGSKEEAIKLYESLQGYNTGWCTAGYKQTAINQVCGGGGYPGGNFYVYYTKDENNEYKIPRVAIRMNGSKYIGEIRGVADSSQNVESGFEGIIEAKLNSMEIDESNKNKYMLAVRDTRELTKLNQKIAKNIPLTIDDQRFILELNHKILGFGWEEDSRIREIRSHVEITDVELALEAVKQVPTTLYYVSEKIQKAHPEIVIEAVKREAWMLRYVSEEMQKAHPEIAVETLKHHPSVLDIISEEIQKAYPEIVIEAVKRYPEGLQYVSEEIQKAYPEMVLEASKQNLMIFKYVSEEIQKAYPEIVLEAVKQDPWVLQDVSEEIQKAHPEIVIEAVKQAPWLLQDVSEEIQKAYPEIFIEAVKQNPWMLRDPGEELRDIVLKSVNRYIDANGSTDEQSVFSRLGEPLEDEESKAVSENDTSLNDGRDR